MLLLQLWSFLCAGALITVTYRLWLPPNWSSFPQIPASEVLIHAPAVCDYLALLGLVVSLLLAVLSVLPVLQIQPIWPIRRLQPIKRIGWLHSACLIAILFFGIALVLLNQHRLQAWFYQLLLYCVVFLLASFDVQLLWLRRVVLSIYVYSALGKLDYEFAHTTGQELLEATFSVLGLKINNWSMNDRLALALGLPLAELLLAIALGWTLLKPKPKANRSLGKWNRIGRATPGLLVCFFHLSLSGLLLWQLQHSWGVVLWNLQFAGQAILLFVLPVFRELSPYAQQSDVATKPIDNFGQVFNLALKSLLMAAILMPAVERLGYWDHWPSWALYAPHSSRVSIALAPFATKQLPHELQAILPEPTADDSAIAIPLGQWSLASLGVPVYPQSRFQLGIARDLANNLNSRFAISAELLSASDRFTGQRQSQILRTADQLQQAGDQFWLNSQPRQSAHSSLPLITTPPLDQE